MCISAQKKKSQLFLGSCPPVVVVFLAFFSDRVVLISSKLGLRTEEMKRKSLHGDSNRKKRRQRCRQRCGHCQQFLSNSQFHEHRRLYFNSSLNQWKTVEHMRKSSVPEDVPGSSSSESEGELIMSNSCSAYMDITHIDNFRDDTCRSVEIDGNHLTNISDIDKIEAVTFCDHPI